MAGDVERGRVLRTHRHAHRIGVSERTGLPTEATVMTFLDAGMGPEQDVIRIRGVHEKRVHIRRSESSHRADAGGVPVLTPTQGGVGPPHGQTDRDHHHEHGEFDEPPRPMVTAALGGLPARSRLCGAFRIVGEGGALTGPR